MDELDPIDRMEELIKELQHENRMLDQQARRARLALIRLIGVHSTEKQLEIIDAGLDGPS